MTGASHSSAVSAEVLRQHMPVHVSEEAREIALDMIDDMAGEVHDGGCYALARWVDAFSRLPSAAQSSDGGVEVRHAETGNMPGSVPGEEVSSAATSFERPTVQGAAIEPCAGVTPGPSEALNPSHVMLELRHAFDGDNVVVKNLMLRKAFGCIKGLLDPAQAETNRGALLELLANAYNEGFGEGMREHTSSQGGWPWNSRKQKYGALLDKALPAPAPSSWQPTEAFIQGVREKCAAIADAKAADENAIFEQAGADEALSDTGRQSIQDRALARNTLAKTIAREIRRIPAVPSTNCQTGGGE